jgi:glutaminase-like protein
VRYILVGWICLVLTLGASAEGVLESDILEFSRQFQVEWRLFGRPPVEVDVQLKSLQGKVPSLSWLKEFCTEIALDESLAFELLSGGCESRAHLIVDKLRKHGVNTSKLFAEGSFAASNELGSTTWAWHVAPLVFAFDEMDNRAKAYVVDPTFGRSPLTPAQWLARFQGPERAELLLEPIERYDLLSPAAETFDENMPHAEQCTRLWFEELKELKEARRARPGWFYPTWYRW